MTTLAVDLLDMRGPQFLLVYAILLAMSAVVGLLAVFFGRSIGKPADVAEPEALGPYDAAFLAGGATRLAEAAVAALYQGGHVRVSGTKELKAVEPVADDAPQVERDVYAAASARGSLRDMRDAAKGSGNVIYHRLLERGLLLSQSHRLLLKLISAAVFLPVLILGIAKINVGLGRDKPILFLGLLCVLTVVLMFALAWHVRTTLAGAAELRALRRKETKRERRERIGSGSESVAWECALFGVAAVSIGELAAMGTFLSPPSNSSGSSDSGCSDGGGGGGCGGGCGGCGD